MTINNLFPIPIGTFDLEPLTEEQHSWIVNQPCIKNIANRISQEKYLLDADIMAPIRSQIETYLLQYFRETVTQSNSVSLRITQSWCNYTGTGEAHHKHQHPNSIISGVYYPQTIKEDKIYFHNERVERSPYNLPKPAYNMYNSESWWISTPQNSLFLFPSGLEHSVNSREYHDAPDRVSLSFNTFYTGEIGEYDNATHLVLS